MHSVARINRTLVVLEDELTGLSGAALVQNSTLLRRALTLARATGSRLDLFHACTRSALASQRPISTAEINREKQRRADRAANRLAEIANELEQLGVSASSEAVWDRPLADAILRQLQCEPYDMVMKRAEAPPYYMGLARHADWELLRRSPCHVWLVRDSVLDCGRIASAFDTDAVTGKPLTERDKLAFDLAASLAQALDTDHLPVHVSQSFPVGVSPGYSSPVGAAVATAATFRRNWNRILRRKKAVLDRFARKQDGNCAGVIHTEGWPARELTRVTEQENVDLIVLGARNLSRIERIFRGVTAEPVLARGNTDVLAARNSKAGAGDRSDNTIVAGEPSAEPQLAILDPASTFASPDRVIAAEGFSASFKKRVLDAWERDVEESEQDDGVLREIAAARRRLGLADRNTMI